MNLSAHKFCSSVHFLQGGGIGSLPPLVARALLSRIRMRKALHMGLERAMRKTKQDLAQACKHFAAGLSEMEMIRSTAKLGAEIVPGFEKGLDQAPAPGGPVRVSQALTLDETWDRFENLLGELQMACSLTTVGGVGGKRISQLGALVYQTQNGLFHENVAGAVEDLEALEKGMD
ncbi:hypothetical protein BSKO_05550 [Bryopsis sp. KO-2023]|nr:hypothetical protein BSKO_05550 [Bryopsis sp. KO-2023]